MAPQYNHGYPASLKNALDYVFPELNRKPIAFVGYGNVGGARAIEQLRLVAVEFEMAPLRHAIHILPDLMSPAMKSRGVHAGYVCLTRRQVDRAPRISSGGRARSPRRAQPVRPKKPSGRRGHRPMDAPS